MFPLSNRNMIGVFLEEVIMVFRVTKLPDYRLGQKLYASVEGYGRTDCGLFLWLQFILRINF
jgi:hypothetical protein